MYGVAWLCYGEGEPGDLYFGEHVIPSHEGVHQRDPLGQLLFSLAIQPLIEKLESEINVWYLDDGTIGGAPDVVMRDFTRILRAADWLGLAVNDAKCELFVDPAVPETIATMDANRRMAPNIQIVKIIHI